ncbi:uncharacterized protein An02g04650 [Aspergillus niger]|uniref:Altered inheritance of mitochondria protein 9, mitochondrial n=2 Tax=Aspergillus niger TaxID=5061 RepID=A2QCT7_ASPNC|nr:uncharacterized protein An02g04650 [Aspergillus niger]CAK44190.1 unnamed protein product [Aspergillus niger]
MDTSFRVVARLPTSIAGPPRLTNNSEVATMAYLRSKFSLPIPKVLDWSDDPANAIGTEYIIQEHVEGVKLHQTWPNMNSAQHMLCTKALSMVIKQMASLDFPAYGSLYFSDAPLEAHLQIPFEQGFCIGPHCSPIFWNRNAGEVELYGGPSPNCGPFMQRLIQDKRIQDAATPALSHPDYHKRNIYVSLEDPTIITGLIDWQSTSIEPAFIYANETPDFATPPHLDDEQPTTPITITTARERKDASICHQTYNVALVGLVPQLRPARLLDPTLFRLFHYTHLTWTGSAAAIRQDLIELSDRWAELGLQGTCPYSLTDEERERHAREYEDFEAVQGLKLWLKDVLNTDSDGWIPNDVWDAARDAHRAAYEEWIQTAREFENRGEEGMTVEKAERLWPFDAR